MRTNCADRWGFTGRRGRQLIAAAEVGTVVPAASDDVATDGLEQPWFGRVFCNPPYGSLSAPFVAKALAEFEAGRLEAAILLLNSKSTDASWFRPLWDQLLCFVYGRIRFHTPAGEAATGGNPSVGSVFVYLGADRACFARVFSRFGAVVERAPSALAEPSAA